MGALGRMCTFSNHLSGYPRGIERVPDALIYGIRQSGNQTLDEFRQNAKVMRGL